MFIFQFTQPSAHSKQFNAEQLWYSFRRLALMLFKSTKTALINSESYEISDTKLLAANLLWKFKQGKLPFLINNALQVDYYTFSTPNKKNRSSSSLDWNFKYNNNKLKFNNVLDKQLWAEQNVSPKLICPAMHISYVALTVLQTPFWSFSFTFQKLKEVLSIIIWKNCKISIRC